MANAIGYPPLRERLVDAVTGTVTRPWAHFVQQVTQNIQNIRNITNPTTIFNANDPTTFPPSGNWLDILCRSIGALAGLDAVEYRGGLRWAEGPWTIGYTGGADSSVAHLLTPPLSSNVGALDIAQAIVVELQALAAIRIDGLSHVSGQRRRVALYNSSAFTVTLAHNSTLVANQDRFFFATGQDYVLEQGEILWFYWPQARLSAQAFAWIPELQTGGGDDFIPKPSIKQSILGRAGDAGNFHATGQGGLAGGSGAAAADADPDANGNYRRVHASGSAGAGWTVQTADLVRVQQNPTYTFDIKTGDSIEAIRIFVYLSSLTATQGNGDTFSGEAIGFRFSTVAGDGGWVGVTRDGTTQSVTATVAPIAVSTRYKLTIRVKDSTVYFSVNDGAEVSTASSLPAATTNLVQWCAIVHGTVADANVKRLSLGSMFGEYGTAA